MRPAQGRTRWTDPLSQATAPKAAEPVTESAVPPDYVIESSDPTEPPPLDDPSLYVIYRDRAESFVCEVKVEGVSMTNVDIRLVLESEDWNLLFHGTVDAAGRCTIPLKKLPILREGLSGRVKIEVIADDTRFVPWENNFVVRASKKVSVVVESRSAAPRVPSVTITR